VSIGLFVSKLRPFLFQEKKAPEIVLKAMGQAISKTVATAEIIKVSLLNFMLLLLPTCSEDK
jgi:hypothetical protein